MLSFLSRCAIASGLAFCCFTNAPTFAAQVVITASRDATLIETDDGSLANGSGEFLFIGRTGQGPGNDLRRSLLFFDVASAVPAGSTIHSVTMTLYLSRSSQAGTEPATVHRLTNSWGEGTSNASGQEGIGAPAQDNDATWLHRFYDIVDPESAPTWTTPGGDFLPAPRATTNVNASVGFYSWASAAMAADVQGWLDNPAANHGWALLGNESIAPTAKRFNSRHNPTVARRPTLTISYSPSCPADIAPSGGDGQVTVADINSVVSAFGPCGGCSQDIVPLPSGDGHVTIADITYVIAAFGSCP